MSLQYIRKAYKVPAKRGGRITYGEPTATAGTITSARGHLLRVRLDGGRRPVLLHPTWRVSYL